MSVGERRHWVIFVETSPVAAREPLAAAVELVVSCALVLPDAELVSVVAREPLADAAESVLPLVEPVVLESVPLVLATAESVLLVPEVVDDGLVEDEVDDGLVEELEELGEVLATEPLVDPVVEPVLLDVSELDELSVLAIEPLEVSEVLPVALGEVLLEVEADGSLLATEPDVELLVSLLLPTPELLWVEDGEVELPLDDAAMSEVPLLLVWSDEPKVLPVEPLAELVSLPKPLVVPVMEPEPEAEPLADPLTEPLWLWLLACEDCGCVPYCDCDCVPYWDCEDDGDVLPNEPDVVSFADAVPLIAVLLL